MAADTLTFRLNIDVDNDAFQPDPRPEVAAILMGIAKQLMADVHTEPWNPDGRRSNTLRMYQTIFDCNGNDVGRFAFKKQGE